jgi:transcription elongation factor Elf1
VFVKNHAGDFVRCPRCNSADVRYADSIRWQDLFLFFVKKHALRCRNCRARFHARTNEAANKMWVE